MRKNILLGLIMSMSLLITASTASALNIDVNITGILDSTFAPKGTIDPSGDEAVATLVAGDIIQIGINVANPDGDLVTDVSGTIIFQGNQLSIFGSPGGVGIPGTTTFGGSSISEILIDQPAGFPPPAPTSLGRVGQPAIKANSPNLDDGSGGDVWLLAMSFAGTGTLGVGPDGAGGPTGDSSTLFFTVLAGAVGNTTLNFDFVQTPGDALNTSGVISVNNAVVNVPEPGTALLMGLGLAGLTAAGRRRN